MNDKKERLQGRVAAVLNERELAINIGGTQGVKQGMIFAIMTESPLEILDPETKEILGTFQREKVRVKAMEVHDKVSICRTYRVYRIPASGIYALMELGGTSEKARDVKETLRVSGDSQPAPLSPEESYVKINDRVVQVEDD